MTTFWAAAALFSVVTLSAALIDTDARADDAASDKAAENFLEADEDANKQLSRVEFRKLIDLNARDKIGRADMIKRFGKYNMAFGRVDANSDGVITPDELSAMAQASR